MTDPVTWPPFFVSNQRLVLDRFDLTTDDDTGAISGVEWGFPQLRLDINIDGVTVDQAVAWEAWIDKLRGAVNGFQVHDLRRLYPKFAIDAGLDLGAFSDGAASTYSLDGGRRVVTMNGFPGYDGFIIQPGDWIGWRDSTGTRRIMHKVMEADTISGGTFEVPVEPAVRPGLDDWSVPVAYLGRPRCLMKLVMSETEIGPTAPDGRFQGRIVAKSYFPKA